MNEQTIQCPIIIESLKRASELLEMLEKNNLDDEQEVARALDAAEARGFERGVEAAAEYMGPGYGNMIRRRFLKDDWTIGSSK